MSELHLVTGGCGFIGSHLVERLVREGKRVRVLDNQSTGKKENIAHLLKDIDFWDGEDIVFEACCKDSLKGVTHVYHLAALGSVPRSWEKPVETLDVNVGGTANMLKFAAAEGVKRFIFASSSSVYGTNYHNKPKEVGIGGFDPRSPYALSKATGEQLCELYNSEYLLPTTVLRYFNVYGPRQRADSQYAAVIPRLISEAANGKRSQLYYRGLQSRDFTYVDTVVEATYRAAMLERAVSCMNVASGKSVQVIDVYKLILRHFHQDDDICVSLVDGGRQSGDAYHSLADVRPMREILDVDPISITEGIARTVAWYKERK
jgi:UDP-N-acetylglucosamine 4-epimerase